MNSEHFNARKRNSKIFSDAGTERREAMRRDLQSEFVQFHTRRRRFRTALAWSPVVVLLMVATGWWVWSTSSLIGPVPQVSENRRPSVEESPRRASKIPVAESTPSHIEFELIDDDQLLDLLAEAGKPSALAWFSGKPVVIPLGK
jgi:hypothetical protein